MSHGPREPLRRQRGARFATHQGVRVAADYGSVDDEHRALRQACGLVDRTWVDRLEMVGEDRLRFLNGLVTCDVKSLAPGEGTYGFLTEVKGHVLADVRVLTFDESLWLELPPGRAGEIAAHLGKYVIVDRVGIRPLERTPLALIGPAAAATLGEAELPAAFYSHRRIAVGGREAVVVREADLEVPVWNLWTSPDDAAAVWEGLVAGGARPAGHEAWDRLRVEAGRPLCGQDYGVDNFPQETGLDDAVSYTKGCYLGQEVVARIHYRGGVNKVLRALAFDGAADPLGKAIVHDGRAAGTVTSAVHSPGRGHLGLAVVHRRLEPGARAEIEGGGTAEVFALPLEPLQ